MRAYESNTVEETAYGRESRLPWSAPVHGGGGAGNLVERFGGMDIGESSNGQIYQVMKAVEDAENTIKQQMKENDQLKEELQRKTRELELYKSGATTSQRLSAGGSKDDHAVDHSPFSEGNEMERNSWMNNGSLHYESNKANGSSKVPPSGQASAENAVTSHFSSPSSRSLSPSRHRKEVEYDPRSNLPGHGIMQVSEIDSSSSLLKQDLILKVREHEEEIFQLKRHLADYSMKEAQIHNEKYVLEKRIAHMRMAFDQQQQDLVDAASKALSYRQDIIEENIRLTYALQAAQQERSTFMSSLLPLLAEYGFQPAVPDAISIVSNLKVLFKHLQEKLIITEEKLKDSQYQLTPWRAEASNYPNFTPQSPSHSFGVAPTTSNKSGLELVPQPPYSHAQSPISSPSNAQTRADWEALGHQNLPSSSSGVATNDLDLENREKYLFSSSRNPIVEDIPAQVAVTQSGSHVRFSVESKNQHPSFKDLARGNEADDSESSGLQHGREPPANWSSGSSPYLAPGLDDQNPTYPYLPPVLEEPSSSVSEAAEDDPLPAIEGLQISGEPYPGKELQACGYSINGTTTCNFEWVRYLEDGSVSYIEGAKQPKYLVTADDVDSYLAIEVQPLDDRKRKGELVKVLANDQRKIACDPKMQEQIERILDVGYESFEVQLSAGVLNIWERAILAIKREGFSIKCNGARGVVVTEKFSTNTNITIPYGHPTEFLIHSSNEVEHPLRTADSQLRDTIVLTLRLFIMRAIEKRKGRRKGLFFKSIS